VLVPDPKAGRELLTKYATLRIAQAQRHCPVAERELADVSHTLCVMMGSSGIEDAIALPDALLAQGRPAATRTADPDGDSGLSLAV